MRRNGEPQYVVDEATMFTVDEVGAMLDAMAADAIAEDPGIWDRVYWDRETPMTAAETNAFIDAVNSILDAFPVTNAIIDSTTPEGIDALACGSGQERPLS